MISSSSATKWRQSKASVMFSSVLHWSECGIFLYPHVTCNSSKADTGSSKSTVLNVIVSVSGEIRQVWYNQLILVWCSCGVTLESRARCSDSQSYLLVRLDQYWNLFCCHSCSSHSHFREESQSGRWLSFLSSSSSFCSLSLFLLLALVLSSSSFSLLHPHFP